MISQWDLVQPRAWLALSSLEQSLMVLEPTSADFRPSTEPPAAATPADLSAHDAEFFADLPRHASAAAAAAPPDQKASLKGATGDARAFATYSFSSSSTVDGHGRRVTSTRRRYEDSGGRLKAEHERDVDGVKMRQRWRRQGSADRHGSIEAECSSGTPEDFEALWLSTPFGEAQRRSVRLRDEAEGGKEPGALQP